MKALFVRKLSVTFVAIASVWVLSGPALALDVTAGYDLFETVPGSPLANGTYADAPALPAGFFGTQGGFPSDPFPGGRLFLDGLPTGPLIYSADSFQPAAPFDELGALAQHGVLDARLGGGLSQTDTIVQRLGTASLPLVGSMDTIPIEIVSLSLQSIQPITVTYGAGGQSFFDVFVTLDGVQSPGSMTLTRTNATGGTFDSQLPVQFKIEFQNTNLGGPSAAGPLTGGDLLTSFNVPFEVLVPEPSTVALLVIGYIGIALYHRKRAR